MYTCYSSFIKQLIADADVHCTCLANWCKYILVGYTEQIMNKDANTNTEPIEMQIKSKATHCCCWISSADADTSREQTRIHTNLFLCCRYRWLYVIPWLLVVTDCGQQLCPLLLTIGGLLVGSENTIFFGIIRSNMSWQI